MISVVLLAYREEESLKLLFPRLIEKMNALGEEYELIVVDTATPEDNTSEVCEKYGARYVNQEEPGFGGAYRKGISVIKGDKMLVLDSDGSHDPKFIPDIYNKFLEGFDVVIGSRYTKGGKTEDAISSRIMSHILNGVYRLVTGVRAKDLSTNFSTLELLSAIIITPVCAVINRVMYKKTGSVWAGGVLSALLALLFAICHVIIATV